ncbi:MAG TPA: hypothetical protein PK431_11605 [Chitinophagales bacterium]|nr:hypothetical protein [Chitinophagales bacterium]
MKDSKEILADLINFKSGLARMYETIHTCNDLHEYVSKIIHYLRVNDIDKNFVYNQYIPQFEVNIGSIRPYINYSLDSKKSQSKFLSVQNEVFTTMQFLIRNFEHLAEKE